MKNILIGLLLSILIAIPGYAEEIPTEPLPIEVESITIQQNLINLYPGDSETIKYYIFPIDAEDQSVIYESSNTEIAAVNQEGKITAISTGTATVSIRTSNNRIAKVNVYVLEKEIQIEERTFDTNTLVIQNYYIIGLLLINVLLQLKRKRIGGH